MQKGDLTGQGLFVGTAVGPTLQLLKAGYKRYFLPKLGQSAKILSPKLYNVVEEVRFAESIKKVSFLKSTTGTNLTPTKFVGSKTFEEMKILLTNKFGLPKSGASGGKSFFNRKSRRTFDLHQQPGHMSGQPHVDIRRRGAYKERKYLLKED